MHAQRVSGSRVMINLYFIAAVILFSAFPAIASAALRMGDLFAIALVTSVSFVVAFPFEQARVLFQALL